MANDGFAVKEVMFCINTVFSKIAVSTYLSLKAQLPLNPARLQVFIFTALHKDTGTMCVLYRVLWPRANHLADLSCSVKVNNSRWGSSDQR